MSKFTRKSQIDASSVPGTAERKRVTLTSAQILALFTTPITLIPAPPAGYFIDIISITAKVKFNSVAYTGANALELRYTGAAGAKVSADLPNTFINSAADAYIKVTQVGVTPVAAAPVVAAVPTANPAAGNSVMGFDILYRTVGIPV